MAWTHLVLVLRAVGVVLLQGGEQTTLRARLGAGVQLTQLHKVMILCHVFLGQVGNHHPLLQVAAALIDGTADVRFGQSHLVGSTLEVRKVRLQLQLRVNTRLFPVKHNISSYNKLLHKKTWLPRSYPLPGKAKANSRVCLQISSIVFFSRSVS